MTAPTFQGVNFLTFSFPYDVITTAPPFQPKTIYPRATARDLLGHYSGRIKCEHTLIVGAELVPFAAAPVVSTNEEKDVNDKGWSCRLHRYRKEFGAQYKKKRFCMVPGIW